MRTTNNPFLNLIGSKIRAGRPLIREPFNFAHRVERMSGRPFITLWFRTRGCQHDFRGGCTMCNYGISSRISAGDMVFYVQQGLQAFDKSEQTMLLVSPSGSMFDEREVPPKARESIFKLIRNTECNTYLCETRAETLTDEKVKNFARILDNKYLAIEIGLESADPWILKYCINKTLSLDEYQRAMELLYKYRISGFTNVILGTPFLSANETIEDVVHTVNWAFKHGTTKCVIFPLHIKRWTVLQWLWEHGAYKPPSLWSLVEVLARLGPHMASKVTISWYKLYREISAGIVLDPAYDLGCLCSPSTCPTCQSQVIKLLDIYRDTNDFNIIKDLINFECTCKLRWRLLLEEKEEFPLKERVIKIYEDIGQDILGAQWWVKNHNDISKQVLA